MLRRHGAKHRLYRQKAVRVRKEKIQRIAEPAV